MKKKALYLAVVLSLFGFTQSAHAIAVPLLDGTGQLTGWNNVTVGGVDYNVEFVEGSFVSVFGAAGTLIEFHTLFDAAAASSALADTYGLNPFYRANPQLTLGIETTNALNGGQLWTAYQLNFGSTVSYSLARTSAGAFNGPAPIDINFDTSVDPLAVYSRWTKINPVPLPAAAYLMGTGLLCLMGFSRKRT